MGVSRAEENAVRLKARPSPSKITLGGECRLMIQADALPSTSVEPPTEKVNLAPFELRRVETYVPQPVGNRVRHIFVLILTVFELGEQQIPPVAIRTRDAAGRETVVWTEPRKVTVVEVKKRSTDKDDIRPIKGPVSMDLSRVWSWAFGLLAALLAAVLAVKVVLRRRKKKMLDLEALLPCDRRAELELGRLQNGGLLEAQKIKEYYSELADILRRYLSRRYAFNAMDLTTSELSDALKARQFARALTEKVRGTLEQADLVKFAKFVPARSLASDLVQQVSSIVDETRPAPAETGKPKAAKKR